ELPASRRIFGIGAPSLRAPAAFCAHLLGARNMTLVSDGQVILLGGIAGATIFLGLPVGRTQRLSSSTRAFLNALAIGILLFLLWDVLSQAIEPVEKALTAAAVDGNGTWARFAGLAAPFTACLGVGL